MKKRDLFILTTSGLMITASILLWIFVPSFQFYTLILIGAVVVIVVIWMLSVIPKLQAAVVARARDATIKPTDIFGVENEARRTLAQIVAGILVIIGSALTVVNLINTQKEAEKNRASAQREAEKNRSLELEGQITDRFTKAITQLDSKNAIELRLGGIYALERIAKDSEKDHWTIMEILTAYVREHAPKKAKDNAVKTLQNRKTNNAEQKEVAELPTDVHAIMTVISRRDSSENRKEGRLALTGTALSKVNLEGVNLIAACLDGADLHGADLRRAKLNEAFLYGTDLINAKLSGANLSYATLDRADLSVANLIKADLQGATITVAYLKSANLSGANLSWANLSSADLIKADLSGADLSGATFTGADLIGADLSKANLSGADLSKANLWGANLHGAFLLGADLSDAKNLSWEQVSGAFVDDETTLPPEMENQHKSELKAMREKTKKELEGK